MAAQQRSDFRPCQFFLLGVGRTHMGDPPAVERLARHMREWEVDRPDRQLRSVPSDNFSGLVVPACLTDMAAAAVATRRPVADISNHHDPPEIVMTVNISRITTPTVVSLQTTENVQTVAG